MKKPEKKVNIEAFRVAEKAVLGGGGGGGGVTHLCVNNN